MTKPKPTCPKCKEEIDRLHYNQTIEKSSRFTVYNNGETHYEVRHLDEYCSEKGYYCLSCGEFVCESEDDAIKILNPNLNQTND